MAKYKKGDIVWFTGSKHCYCKRPGLRKDGIYRVRRSDSIRDDTQCYEVYGTIYVMYEDELVLLRPMYKPGDRVRVCNTNGFSNCQRGFHIGDIVEIDGYDTVYKDFITYKINGSCRVLREDEIEPVDDTVTVTFDAPLFNKKMAHSIAHHMVEKAYNDAESASTKSAPKQPEDWTYEEIKEARELIVSWVVDIIKSGGEVFWITPEVGDQRIICFYYPTFGSVSSKDGVAKPMPNGDLYNVWIGKCVSLARALGRPVPEFIRKKNTGVK